MRASRAAGVVTVSIPRRDTIVVARKPEMGVQTTVAFEPLGGGQHAAVAPDFALTSSEVNRSSR